MRLCYNQYKTDSSDTVRVVNASDYAISLKERFSEEKMYANFIEGMGITEEEFNVESWLNDLDIEEVE